MLEYGSYGLEYYIILQGKTSIWYKVKEYDSKMKEFHYELSQLHDLKLSEKERIRSSFNGVPKMSKSSLSSVKFTEKYGLSVEYGN